MLRQAACRCFLACPGVRAHWRTGYQQPSSRLCPGYCSTSRHHSTFVNSCASHASSAEYSNADGALSKQKSLQPGLYLVGTPIGNLEDMSFRAVQTLQQASAILAEDTRHTRKLLNHFQIATKLYSFHQHNEKAKEALVRSASAAENIWERRAGKGTLGSLCPARLLSLQSFPY